MHLVIPSINCHYKDFQCVEERVRIAESIMGFRRSPIASHGGLFSWLNFGSKKHKNETSNNERAWVHVDVSDGAFTFNRSWDSPREWKKLNSLVRIEVHLMVENPELVVDGWLGADAGRIIVHVETVNPKTLERIVNKCEKSGAKLMLASNPETDVEDALWYKELTDQFQVLAVHPGPSGQKFLPVALEKIRKIREEIPYAIIEVDGGVNGETGRTALEAGADILVAGNAIFGSRNPKESYEKFSNLGG